MTHRIVVTRTRMIDAAKAAGLAIREEGGRLHIARGAVGIVVTEGGSIYRTDAALVSANNLTPSRAAAVLGITFDHTPSRDSCLGNV